MVESATSGLIYRQVGNLGIIEVYRNMRKRGIYSHCFNIQNINKNELILPWDATRILTSLDIQMK